MNIKDTRDGMSLNTKEREALERAAEGLEHAACWLRSVGSHQNAEFAEQDARNVRAALATREEPRPDARVTVGQSRIGPASAAVNKRRKRCDAGDPTPSGPVNDVEAEAINRAYDAMLDETELPDDFDAARKMAMAAIAAARKDTERPDGENGE